VPTVEELVAKLTPPTAYQRRPVNPELAAEHGRFVAMLPELMKSIPGKYVAMNDVEIVTVADDEVDALTEAGEKQPGVVHLARMATDQPIPIDRLILYRRTPPSRAAHPGAKHSM